MRAKVFAPAAMVWLSSVIVLWTPVGREAFAKDAPVKLEVQLIWGTNDKESPDPKHKPVDPDILKKLTALPLKWNNWFEVNRKQFEVPVTGATNVTVGKCQIGVKRLENGGGMEVSFVGKGKPVETHRQKLPPKGDILIYGGNAPNSTAYLVTLKRVE